MISLLITIAAVIAVTGLGALGCGLRRLLRVVTVVGDSMRPALAPGDRLLVRRVPLARVRAGDIVAVAYPKQGPFADAFAANGDCLIKRAIATPGAPVPDSVAGAVGAEPGSTVPDGALVVVGDNREDSFDSREFGYVAAAGLLGVVLRPMYTGRTATPPHVAESATA